MAASVRIRDHKYSQTALGATDLGLASAQSAPVQHYLAAHQRFVEWLDDLSSAPDPHELERRLRSLAMVAAARGMSSTHWAFVVDGLIAHVNRHHPGDVLLSSYVARGFDYSHVWEDLQRAMDSAQSG